MSISPNLPTTLTSPVEYTPLANETVADKHADGMKALLVIAYAVATVVSAFLFLIVDFAVAAIKTAISKNKFNKSNDAALKMQKTVRGGLIRTQARKANAATKIQSLARGVQGRSQALRFKVAKEAALRGQDFEATSLPAQVDAKVETAKNPKLEKLQEKLVALENAIYTPLLNDFAKAIQQLTGTYSEKMFARYANAQKEALLVKYQEEFKNEGLSFDKAFVSNAMDEIISRLKPQTPAHTDVSQNNKSSKKQVSSSKPSDIENKLRKDTTDLEMMKNLPTGSVIVTNENGETQVVSSEENTKKVVADVLNELLEKAIAKQAEIEKTKAALQTAYKKAAQHGKLFQAMELGKKTHVECTVKEFKQRRAFIQNVLEAEKAEIEKTKAALQTAYKKAAQNGQLFQAMETGKKTHVECTVKELKQRRNLIKQLFNSEKETTRVVYGPITQEQAMTKKLYNNALRFILANRQNPLATPSTYLPKEIVQVILKDMEMKAQNVQNAERRGLTNAASNAKPKTSEPKPIVNTLQADSNGVLNLDLAPQIPEEKPVTNAASRNDVDIYVNARPFPAIGIADPTEFDNIAGALFKMFLYDAACSNSSSNPADVAAALDIEIVKPASPKTDINTDHLNKRTSSVFKKSVVGTINTASSKSQAPNAKRAGDTMSQKEITMKLAEQQKKKPSSKATKATNSKKKRSRKNKKDLAMLNEMAEALGLDRKKNKKKFGKK